MSLGKTFQEKYQNFFDFFGKSSRTLEEIDNFINDNKIPNFSRLNRINLNMIDPQNLNILFHIVRKSDSDKDCVEKLKLLIEKYHVKYNLFDGKHHRMLPFYTCVKGFLLSTKYLIEKMNYNINYLDFKQETIFFSAMRSYNVELVKYLDEKFTNWIFFPNSEYNSCIYYIFKDSMKKEGEENIKGLLRFIINKGFDIEEKNNNNFSFKDLCSTYGIINYLDEIIKEIKAQKIEKDQKLLYDNDVNVNLINKKWDKNNYNKFENYINININKENNIQNDNIINTNIFEEDKNREDGEFSSFSKKFNMNKINVNIVDSRKKEEYDDNRCDDTNSQIINNKGIKFLNNISSNVDNNKMIEDNSDNSLNNISIINSNKTKKSNISSLKNNDLNNDPEYFSFSDYSGLFFNNPGANERKDNPNYFLNSNHDDNNIKCCIFVNNKNNSIIMDEIIEQIKQNENLRIYAKKIIHHKLYQNNKEMRRKKLKKK